MEENREQRKTSSMEESSAMTIEFLRARLLSERAISKSARQRADDLAKRVAELEEQLKFVSLQRKKAEKATTDVLAILENRGTNDVSEEFDSSSEKDESLHDFKVDDGSSNTKPGDNEEDDNGAYSSSEIESSTSTGRSLSWTKGTNDSQHSVEAKKYTESARRRATSVSNSSSSRRVGKSCRKLRRKETSDRSTEDSQKGDTERAMRALDDYDGETGLDGVESTASELLGENRETDGDMENALQRQAQLIGRYKEQEKAQTEWEEKFRENNNGAQEPCDPGNHSDVTEERYEMDTHELSRKSIPDNQKTKQELNNTDPQTRNSLPPLTKVDKDEPSASEFSFPTSKEISGDERKPLYPSTHNTPSLELAVLPQESSSNLGSVLQSLQQAKLSLNQQLRPPVAAETSRNVLGLSHTKTQKTDSFNVPIIPPSLFRLPTDIGVQPGHSNFTPEIASSRFLSEPLADRRTAFHGSLFQTAPYGSFGPDIRSVAPPQRSFSQPRPSEGPSPFNRMDYLDSHTSRAHSLVENTYPYLPDFTLSLPSNEGGPSRTFPSSGSGLPPALRFSSYYDQFRPNR